MRLSLHLAVSLISLCAVCGAKSGMAGIPASVYRPLFRGEKDAKEVSVAAFQLDVRPVTNGEFLVFVRENPKWRRSQVKRLFADEKYLAHWSGDLDLGNARPEQPVTNISWFAAKAFAASRGKRLPTTAEWEVAAGAGFTVRDGAKDAEFQSEVARWYATPSPAVLPDVGGRANVLRVRDLHGLVWEWTSDFNSAMVTGDARGDSGLERQLFCGAGAAGAKDTSNYTAFMRFGFRSSLRAGYTVHNLGFRCASDGKNSKF
jgi:formylglycine-generating enzyme